MSGAAGQRVGTRFVSLAEALALQALLCRRFGGDPAVVDPGLLEGALARCRSAHYASLSEQAAALLHALADEHPMASGNRRFAFALASTFLRLNGYRLQVSPAAAAHFLREQVLARQANTRHIARALERTMRPF